MVSQSKNGREIVVVGIDPGLANSGFTAIKVVPLQNHKTKMWNDHVKVIKSDYFTTKKSSKKTRRLDEDLKRRLREIVLHYGEVLDDYKPRVAAFEALSYPRNAVAASMLAMSWGSIYTLCAARGIPVFLFSPQEIKVACGCTKKASKEEVQKAIEALWPFNGWPKTKKREHAFDGAGAALALIKDEQFNILRRC